MQIPCWGHGTKLFAAWPTVNFHFDKPRSHCPLLVCRCCFIAHQLPFCLLELSSCAAPYQQGLVCPPGRLGEGCNSTVFIHRSTHSAQLALRIDSWCLHLEQAKRKNAFKPRACSCFGWKLQEHAESFCPQVSCEQRTFPQMMFPFVYLGDAFSDLHCWLFFGPGKHFLSSLVHVKRQRSSF